MWRLLGYYGRYQGFRGTLSQMPGWARLLVFLAALPGLVLIGLSILAFGVSILALFLLTAPVYRLLSWVLGLSGLQAVESGDAADVMDDVTENTEPTLPSPGRRHVDVTIIDDQLSGESGSNHG